MTSGLVQTKLSRTVIGFYEWDVGLIIKHCKISFNVGDRIRDCVHLMLEGFSLGIFPRDLCDVLGLSKTKMLFSVDGYCFLSIFCVFVWVGA
eukprot:SAG31_NODE_6123_length_2158_cov_2.617776_1_plen_92_part_00